jgi:hypothetical protein
MKDTGGPAFPQYVINNGGAYVDGGMTLRDYFAAKAMQGLLGGRERALTAEEWAEQAYRMADTMLAERSKT